MHLCAQVQDLALIHITALERQVRSRAIVEQTMDLFLLVLNVL